MWRSISDALYVGDGLFVVIVLLSDCIYDKLTPGSVKMVVRTSFKLASSKIFLCLIVLVSGPQHHCLHIVADSHILADEYTTYYRPNAGSDNAMTHAGAHKCMQLTV